MAVDAVIVAFRAGMYVTDMAKRIAPSYISDESWSTVVVGSTSFEAVHEFCTQSVCVFRTFIGTPLDLCKLTCPTASYYHRLLDHISVPTRQTESQ